MPSLKNRILSADLRGRIFKAGLLTLLGFVGNQILRFGSNLVLTRLLAPEMFGLMSIAMVIMIGLYMFSDAGLFQNIVRSKNGESRVFLNTAWVIQIVRGILIFLCALAVSVGLKWSAQEGWFKADSVFSDPLLPYIVAALSSVAVIQGFNSTELHVLNRKLQVGKLTIIELLSQGTGIALTIVLSLMWTSVWPLVIGIIFSSLIKLMLSHTYLREYQNKFEWDQESFLEIFHFGKWIFISSILGFMVLNGDRLLLSIHQSSHFLGVYSIAFFLATAVSQLIKNLSDKILLPALGEVARERPEKLSGNYYRARSVIDKVSMFIAGLLFVSGQDIVRILYDDRYIDAGWMLEILALSVIGSGFLMADKCLVVLGYAKERTLLTFVNFLTLYALFPIAYKQFDVQGAIWLIALSWVPRTLVSFYLMRKYRLLKLTNEFRMFPFVVAGGIFGYIVSLGVNSMYVP